MKRIVETLSLLAGCIALAGVAQAAELRGDKAVRDELSARLQAQRSALPDGVVIEGNTVYQSRIGNGRASSAVNTGRKAAGDFVPPMQSYVSGTFRESSREATFTSLTVDRALPPNVPIEMVGIDLYLTPQGTKVWRTAERPVTSTDSSVSYSFRKDEFPMSFGTAGVGPFRLQDDEFASAGFWLKMSGNKPGSNYYHVDVAYEGPVVTYSMPTATEGDSRGYKLTNTVSFDERVGGMAVRASAEAKHETTGHVAFRNTITYERRELTDPSLSAPLYPITKATYTFERPVTEGGPLVVLQWYELTFDSLRVGTAIEPPDWFTEAQQRGDLNHATP